MFDPASGTNGTWTRTGDLHRSRLLHTATLLPTGRVLVAGGWDGDDSLDVAEVFDPATRAFSFASGHLSQARNRHTATLLNDGRVLVAGGEFARNGVIEQVLSSAEIFAGTG